MIVKEFHSVRSDGTILFKTYSNEGFYIQKVGTDEIYAEAIDIEKSGFRYEETETLIEKDNNDNDKKSIKKEY